MKLKNAFLVGLSSAALLSSASAATIFQIDYDTFTPSYDQADPGTIATKSTGAGGVSGNGLFVDFNTSTGNPFSISYFANFRRGLAGLDTPTSADASQYVLSFSAKADGLASGQTGGGETSIKLGDATFKANISVTAAYQVFSFNLGAMTLSGGTFGLDDFDAGDDRQFKIAQQGISSKYGQDNDNRLSIDNITLTQIPEPSSMVLLGLGSLALFARRRR